MALADYFLCSVCNGKTFYDAHVDYDWYTEPKRRNRADGYPLPCGAGDMAALCEECAKDFEVVVCSKTERAVREIGE